MTTMLKHWILSAIVIGLAAYLIPAVDVTLLGAFVGAAVLGLLTIFIKPILTVLTLPINILTLGLFSFIINTTLILVTSAVVPGFEVGGFWWALIFAVVLSLFNVVFGTGIGRR